MKAALLMTASYPCAVLHMDADAFFASVEQALNASLRGKPVVTGQERGVIACASYEAKAKGVRRGITLSDAKRMCPDLIILPSDYETYGLYSKRMFNVMREYTPIVEEYSIDEAFADITGLRRTFRTSYEEIALKIREKIQRELGITVSVGLSVSKALAKLCSNFRKPQGFTAVQGKHIHLLLQRTPLDRVWGIGPNTVSLLKKRGLNTAYDFVLRPEGWVKKLLYSPGQELWRELRGHSLWKVNPEEKASYATIIKSKTFTPPTSERTFVYAKLMHNVESAFAKARRYRLRPRTLGVVLRRSDFHHDGLEAKLNRATSSSLEVVPLIRRLFDHVFVNGTDYRATMIVLGNLENDNCEQFEFFQDRLKIESLRRATRAIDAINRKYGKDTVSTATSLYLSGRRKSSREESPARKGMLMDGETERRRLAIPRMDIAV
ncbi:DNA polymerase IV [Verrucomicrobiota bacterium]